MLSWQAYRRNVPRYGVARLVFFGSVAVFFAVMPLLEGAAYGSSTLGVGAGILIPVIAKAWVIDDPERTLRALRGLGIALPLACLAYQYGKLAPHFFGIISALGVGWATMWVVLMTDSDVGPQSET